MFFLNSLLYFVALQPTTRIAFHRPPHFAFFPTFNPILLPMTLSRAANADSVRIHKLAADLEKVINSTVRARRELVETQLALERTLADQAKTNQLVEGELKTTIGERDGLALTIQATSVELTTLEMKILRTYAAVASTNASMLAPSYADVKNQLTITKDKLESAASQLYTPSVLTAEMAGATWALAHSTSARTSLGPGTLAAKAIEYMQMQAHKRAMRGSFSMMLSSAGGAAQNNSIRRLSTSSSSSSSSSSTPSGSSDFAASATTSLVPLSGSRPPPAATQTAAGLAMVPLSSLTLSSAMAASTDSSSAPSSSASSLSSSMNVPAPAVVMITHLINLTKGPQAELPSFYPDLAKALLTMAAPHLLPQESLANTVSIADQLRSIGLLGGGGSGHSLMHSRASSPSPSPSPSASSSLLLSAVSSPPGMHRNLRGSIAESGAGMNLMQSQLGSPASPSSSGSRYRGSMTSRSSSSRPGNHYNVSSDMSTDFSEPSSRSPSRRPSESGTATSALPLLFVNQPLLHEWFNRCSERRLRPAQRVTLWIDVLVDQQQLSRMYYLPTPHAAPASAAAGAAGAAAAGAASPPSSSSGSPSTCPIPVKLDLSLPLGVLAARHSFIHGGTLLVQYEPYPNNMSPCLEGINALSMGQASRFYKAFHTLWRNFYDGISEPSMIRARRAIAAAAAVNADNNTKDSAASAAAAAGGGGDAADAADAGGKKRVSASTYAATSAGSSGNPATAGAGAPLPSETSTASSATPPSTATGAATNNTEATTSSSSSPPSPTKAALEDLPTSITLPMAKSGLNPSPQPLWPRLGAMISVGRDCGLAFDPSTDAWRELPDVAHHRPFSAAAALRPASATLLPCLRRRLQLMGADIVPPIVAVYYVPPVVNKHSPSVSAALMNLPVTSALFGAPPRTVTTPAAPLLLPVPFNPNAPSLVGALAATDGNTVSQPHHDSSGVNAAGAGAGTSRAVVPRLGSSRAQLSSSSTSLTTAISTSASAINVSTSQAQTQGQAHQGQGGPNGAGAFLESGSGAQSTQPLTVCFTAPMTDELASERGVELWLVDRFLQAFPPPYCISAVFGASELLGDAAADRYNPHYQQQQQQQTHLSPSLRARGALQQQQQQQVQLQRGGSRRGLQMAPGTGTGLLLAADVGVGGEGGGGLGRGLLGTPGGRLDAFGGGGGGGGSAGGSRGGGAMGNGGGSGSAGGGIEGFLTALASSLPIGVRDDMEKRLAFFNKLDWHITGLIINQTAAANANANAGASGKDGSYANGTGTGTGSQLHGGSAGDQQDLSSKGGLSSSSTGVRSGLVRSFAPTGRSRRGRSLLNGDDGGVGGEDGGGDDDDGNEADGTDDDVDDDEDGDPIDGTEVSDSDSSTQSDSETQIRAMRQLAKQRDRERAEEYARQQQVLQEQRYAANEAKQQAEQKRREQQREEQEKKLVEKKRLALEKEMRHMERARKLHEAEQERLRRQVAEMESQATAAAERRERLEAQRLGVDLEVFLREKRKRQRKRKARRPTAAAADEDSSGSGSDDDNDGDDGEGGRRRRRRRGRGKDGTTSGSFSLASRRRRRSRGRGDDGDDSDSDGDGNDDGDEHSGSEGELSDRERRRMLQMQNENSAMRLHATLTKARKEAKDSAQEARGGHEKDRSSGTSSSYGSGPPPANAPPLSARPAVFTGASGSWIRMPADTLNAIENAANAKNDAAKRKNKRGESVRSYNGGRDSREQSPRRNRDAVVLNALANAQAGNLLPQKPMLRERPLPPVVNRLYRAHLLDLDGLVGSYNELLNPQEAHEVSEVLGTTGLQRLSRHPGTAIREIIERNKRLAATEAVKTASSSSSSSGGREEGEETMDAMNTSSRGGGGRGGDGDAEGGVVEQTVQRHTMSSADALLTDYKERIAQLWGHNTPDGAIVDTLLSMTSKSAAAALFTRMAALGPDGVTPSTPADVAAAVRALAVQKNQKRLQTRVDHLQDLADRLAMTSLMTSLSDAQARSNATEDLAREQYPDLPTLSSTSMQPSASSKHLPLSGPSSTRSDASPYNQSSPYYSSSTTSSNSPFSSSSSSSSTSSSTSSLYPYAADAAAAPTRDLSGLDITRDYLSTRRFVRNPMQVEQEHARKALRTVTSSTTSMAGGAASASSMSAYLTNSPSWMASSSSSSSYAPFPMYGIDTSLTKPTSSMSSSSHHSNSYGYYGSGAGPSSLAAGMGGCDKPMRLAASNYSTLGGTTSSSSSSSSYSASSVLRSGGAASLTSGDRHMFY